MGIALIILRSGSLFVRLLARLMDEEVGNWDVRLTDQESIHVAARSSEGADYSLVMTVDQVTLQNHFYVAKTWY